MTRRRNVAVAQVVDVLNSFASNQRCGKFGRNFIMVKINVAMRRLKFYISGRIWQYSKSCQRPRLTSIRRLQRTFKVTDSIWQLDVVFFSLSFTVSI